MARKRKVDYRCRSPAEGMMAKQHPEAWKRVCEDDSKDAETNDKGGEHAVTSQESEYPEFDKLEKIPGVDYGIHGLWQGTIKLSSPEKWKSYCESNPKRNPHLQRGL